MWPFGKSTDSPDATSVENTNNAAYKEGYDSGRGGDFISDIAHTIGVHHGSTANVDQYDKGYAEGSKAR